jgi:hypothetical protein
VDEAGHDTDLAAAGGDDTRAVRTDETVGKVGKSARGFSNGSLSDRRSLRLRFSKR